MRGVDGARTEGCGPARPRSQGGGVDDLYPPEHADLQVGGSPPMAASSPRAARAIGPRPRTSRAATGWISRPRLGRGSGRGRECADRLADHRLCWPTSRAARCWPFPARRSIRAAKGDQRPDPSGRVDLPRASDDVVRASRGLQRLVREPAADLLEPAIRPTTGSTPRSTPLKEAPRRPAFAHPGSRDELVRMCGLFPRPGGAGGAGRNPHLAGRAELASGRSCGLGMEGVPQLGKWARPPSSAGDLHFSSPIGRTGSVDSGHPPPPLSAPRFQARFSRPFQGQQ